MKVQAASAGLIFLLLGGCQIAKVPAVGLAGQAGEIDAAELRSVLADLARAHDQKLQLAFYVSLPWQRMDAPFDAFFSNMGKVQKELLTDLEKWAKEHQVSLAHQFGEDTSSRALKIMEARQEKVIRGAAKQDFPRDALMQMYADYEWQISVVEALLPRVKDAGLKAYLEKSLKVHSAGSAEIVRLLKGYRYQGG